MPRRLDAAWTMAIAAGLIGAIVFPGAARLADPPRCTGLLELSAIIASRTSRDTPLADVLALTNRVFVLLALLLFVRVVQRVATGRAAFVAPVAAAFAVFSTAAFAPLLAPSNAAAIAAACGVLLAISPPPPVSGERPGRRFTAAVIALAVLVSIAPALLAPAILLVLWLATDARGLSARAVGLAMAGVAALVAGPALVTLSVPPISLVGRDATTALGCAMPNSPAWTSHSVAALSAALGPTSLYAAALAVLGGFALISRKRSSVVMNLGMLALPAIVVTVLGAPDPVRTLSPLVAVFWVLSAIGLHEIVTAIAPVGVRWIAVAIVALGLPVLQLSKSRQPEVDAANQIRGHDRLSFSRFRQLMSALPPGSVLVDEDAIVSILAHDAARRAGDARALRIVDRDFRILKQLPQNTTLFTLPRGQSLLQHFGYQLIDLSARAKGLAEARAGAGCVAVRDAWQDASQLTTAEGLALVAEEPDGRGPVVMYLGAEAGHPYPERLWADRFQRGFAWHDFDLQREGQRARLAAAIERDDAPAAHAVFQQRHIVHLEIWRVLGAPISLPVWYRTVPAAALVRKPPYATTGAVSLCPWTRFEVKGLFEE